MLYAGALGLALVIALLAVPVRIDYSIWRRDCLGGSARAIWLFGLVRAPIPFKTGKPSAKVTSLPADKHHAGPKTAKKAKMGGRLGVARFSAVMRNRPFHRRIFKLIRDMAGAVKMFQTQFYAVAGLEDPADTGMLWGSIYPLLAASGALHSGAFSLRPDFTGRTFRFSGSGSVRIIPLQVLFIVASFLLSPATLRMIWMLKPWKR